jgi:TatA/E family protein of Tat protein translocase
VVLLILESLGSTELLFILVMALVFFGPRKLPQISRSLGKHVADFRRASEDFKRTWDKEATLEESSAAIAGGAVLPGENSILDNEKAGQPVLSPTIQVIAPDRVIARHSMGPDAPGASENAGPASADGADLDGATDETQPSSKRDWL